MILLSPSNGLGIGKEIMNDSVTHFCVSCNANVTMWSDSENNKTPFYCKKCALVEVSA